EEVFMAINQLTKLCIIPLHTIMLITAVSTAAFGQSDFPSPSFPTYTNPEPTMPTNGGQNSWGGIKWGPYYVNARKGDTIVFKYRMDCQGCYWRFAIMQSSPMISNGTNMRLDYSDTGGVVNGRNQWGRPLDNGYMMTWCIECTFRVEAGDDYP